MKTGRPSPSAILTALALAAIAIGSVWFTGTPPQSAAGIETTGFSTARAMEHVEALAERPHPMGSADHARVRDYLAQTLQKTELGVEHQVTTATRTYRRSGSPGLIRAGRVHNLLARVRGTDSTGAILLASHYDSVAAGPGAADATSCVAAILEAVRALREGPPLRNDLIVLLTDGEEDGLLGAAAFVEQHPWAKDVRFILNFEARGTGGPSQMFETSTGNGVIVSEWASGTPYATGSSLGYEIYKRLPNDTDFTMFKRLNAEGLNFAFIDNVEAYHTRLDAPSALDRGSVAAHGAAALALARRFGDIDLNALDARDAVFFSLPLGYALSYSTLWTLPLTGLAAVAWLMVFVHLRRRGAASAGGVVLAVIVTAVLAAGCLFAGFRFNRLPAWLHEHWFPQGAVSTNAAYALALVGLLGGCWLAALSVLRRWFKAHTLALGASFVWLIAAAAAAWWLPGASYVIFWPVAATIAATALLPRDAAGQSSLSLRAMLLWLLAIPTLAVVTPTAATLFSAVGIGLEGGTALAFCVLLTMGALTPQLEMIIEGRRWWPAVVAFLASLGALAAGAWTAPYGPGHPQPVNVLYALDADAGRAQWASATPRMLPWLEQYLTAAPSRGPLDVLSGSRASGDYFQHEAPVLPLAPPEAASSAEASADGDRFVTLHVVSPRGARTVSLSVADATVVDTWLDGRRIGGEGGSSGWEHGRWALDYVNPPASGFDVQLRIKGRIQATLTLVDRTHGLPEIDGFVQEPRPSSLMTIHSGDLTVVRRSVKF